MMPDEDREVVDTKSSRGLAAKLALLIGLLPRDPIPGVFMSHSTLTSTAMLPLEKIE
jgi:hypothetical protein